MRAVRAEGASTAHGGVRIIPPAIDPLSPKNMAFSPEDAAFVCSQFGIDVDRPLITQVSRFDPWKDPIGVIDAYREVTKQVPGGAAGDGRLDGDRRPRGLGVLPADLRVRRRRPRHQDPQQPQQRRRDRGQRLPVAVRRLPAEVDPRGLRADRHRGALEGAADDRPATSAASRCRSRTGRRLPGRLARASAPSAASRSSRTRSWARGSAAPGKEHARSGSSRRACCATGCGSSPRWTHSDQFGYSSLRQARGSSGCSFGVRSRRNEWYGATNGSGAIT